MTVLSYLSTLVLTAIAGIGIAKDWKSYGRFVRWALSVLVGISAILSVAMTYEAQKVASAEAHRRAQAGTIAALPSSSTPGPAARFPRIEIGTSGSIFEYAGSPAKPLFRVFEDNDITIARENGQVKVSALIRDRSGKIVAELVKNEWRVNPSAAWDRNYSNDSLEVRNEQGDVVLQVQVLPDRIRFQAKLYGPHGDSVTFCNPPNPGLRGGIIEVLGPGDGMSTLTIRPRFKYPSELHLGELVVPREAI